MRYLKLGSSDLNASVIGMGAWAIGGGSSWGSHVDDDLAIQTIEKALTWGSIFRHRPRLWMGHSEKLLGRVIQGRRDQFIVATKCGLWWDDRTRFFLHGTRRTPNLSLLETRHDRHRDRAVAEEPQHRLYRSVSDSLACG
ncbi:MAG: aldo/keto reductase [Pirellulaceae bacterium]